MADVPPLAPLGLDTAEENVYRALVARGSATEAELDENALTSLRARGLVVAGVRPGTYRAAPPLVALGSLLSRRYADLHAAETAVAALAAQHRSNATGPTGAELVEVISGAAEVRERCASLRAGARRRLRMLVTGRSQACPIGVEPIGVPCRAVLEQTVLERPTVLESILAGPSAGGEVRVATAVPVDVLIADEDAVLVWLSDAIAASVRAGLATGLAALFDLVWDRSRPVRPGGAPETLLIDPYDARILGLLIAGLTDHSVAGQLGMSPRTVQRRIRHLMDLAGVQTRLQLGWHAARAGWV